jgi:hypothetical protein
VGQLPPDIVAAHEEAIALGERMYRDPTSGLWVMTAEALADRGHCCGAGCRHCPYPIGEQRRAGRPAS